MKVCFFAHYDKTGAVHRYVKDYLLEISKYVDKIYFASDCDLKEIPDCVKIVNAIRHGGYDFYSWKLCSRSCKDNIDELYLINDSCFCLGSLKELFNVKRWGGIYRSDMRSEHICSYFLKFKGDYVNKAREFLKCVRKQKTKEQVCKLYERGLSKFMGMESVEYEKKSHHSHRPYSKQCIKDFPLLKKLIFTENPLRETNLSKFVLGLKYRNTILDYLYKQGYSLLDKQMNYSFQNVFIKYHRITKSFGFRFTFRILYNIIKWKIRRKLWNT